MSVYSEFFFGSPPSSVQLDCVEIIHPSFSQTYRVVRNHTLGVSVTHEGPDGPYDYEYYPLKVVPVGSDEDSRQSLSITVGDLGDIIATEMRNVLNANTANTEPVVNFRTYDSSDLTAPIYGPLSLIIKSVTCNNEGASFVAQARDVNRTRTGEIYDPNRFPMIKGFG